jgi:DNA-binding NarL/FixJ family response regulator
VTLSKRRKQVCILIAKDVPNKLIAEKLGITKRTVEKHRDFLYKTLRVHSSVRITHYALAQGWVRNFYL